ncbi:hypothetical protein ACGF5F_12970 [Streptomyces sp. NPDC047821]|uniref:hypothetical protein n=1 Tax=Streptomyces sp. NPDC047821 TaxID=3365488 RepID=UPI00371936D7
MDNWREGAWNGHQNEPHDSTVQLDSVGAFDAFGHRADGAGFPPGGQGHQTYGHPDDGAGYAPDIHGHPAGAPAHAPGGREDETIAYLPGREDETIAYRADSLGLGTHAPAHGGTDVADPEFGTAELPAVTVAVPASAPRAASAPAPMDQEPSDGPVFVDESGRRSKKFRRLGWVLATACAVYAITLVVSVIGGNSSAPWLLIPGPADEKKTETTQVEPAPTATEAPDGDTPGAVPGAPAPTDSTGAVIPQPADGGPQGLPATPRPGTSSATGATPPAGATGGTDVEEPDSRPTPNRPTDGATPQPPPIVPPEKTADPEPTDVPTTPTEEPTDPPVGESGGQQMAAEGAQ